MIVREIVNLMMSAPALMAAVLLVAAGVMLVIDVIKVFKLQPVHLILACVFLVLLAPKTQKKRTIIPRQYLQIITYI